MASLKDFAGRWALVTGASAGIGAALAKELARHGVKLILTARRVDRLEALAAEVRAQGTEVRLVPADLTDRAAPAAIYAATVGAGLEVDILINNAGLGHYGAFATLELEQELSQIRVNCEAMVHLARLFVPAMVERRRGWVMVVASVASFQPLPYLSTYAATKGFDRFFALGLAEEVSAAGVKVSALCPGPTESEFFEVSKVSRDPNTQAMGVRHRQSAEEVARAGVKGLARGKRTVIPTATGAASALAVRLLPGSLITGIVGRMLRPGR